MFEINKKNIAVLSLTLITILVSINNGYNFAVANVIEDFTYNDNLVAPYELSWVMTTFYVTDDSFLEDFIWEITPAVNMTQGDIFKIEFLEDPDNLVLSDYGELFTTNDTWAEFYLNSDLLGDDASLIGFNITETSLSTIFPVKFIYPQTVQVGGAEISTFDLLYDDLSQNEFSSSWGKYKVSNGADAFSVEIKVHMSYGEIETDEEAKVTYNKEWGVLSTYELYLRAKNIAGVQEVEILLEITDEDIKIAPFGWIAGIPVLITLGVITLRRKKRNKT